MKKLHMLVLMLCLAIVLAACNNDSSEENENTEENASEQQQELEITDDEKLSNEEPVANVNGEEIKGIDYNPVYTQVKTMMYQYGQDVSDLEAIQKQTTNILVEQELIKQDAEKLGIEVTEEEAQEELDKIKESGTEEEFAAVLEQYNMSEEDFKNQLLNDLITVKYMEDQFKVEVTDEEVQEYYEQLKEQNSEIGEFEEVESQIKDILVNEQQSEQLRARVDELMESAEVETLI